MCQEETKRVVIVHAHEFAEVYIRHCRLIDNYQLILASNICCVAHTNNKLWATQALSRTDLVRLQIDGERVELLSWCAPRLLGTRHSKIGARNGLWRHLHAQIAVPVITIAL